MSLQSSSSMICLCCSVADTGSIHLRTVVQISPVHFAAGLDLVGGSLRVLLSQRCYPTPNEFVRCLVPEGNFFLSHVDADWGVNLEDSFVFSVLAIVSPPSLFWASPTS